MLVTENLRFGVPSAMAIDADLFPRIEARQLRSTASILGAMPVTLHNPADVFPPYRCYSHAAEVRGDSRLLVLSGLNGYEADGKSLPASFEAQGDLIWRHMGTILRAAGMEYRNLISVRTYLASPAYDEPNVQLRMKYLGDHRPSLTVVCCQLLDPAWMLEVEAMAAT
jgi:enamine deaminase RidA (YjgF/YER057c/UK114 family)